MARGEPGQLATLVHRYFDEVDAFNTRALTDASTDEEADALAEATYNATLRQMIGVPARTMGDALAALDWLIKEGADLENEYAGDLFFGAKCLSMIRKSGNRFSQKNHASRKLDPEKWEPVFRKDHAPTKA
jgi:hypothetical protein